MPGYYFLEVGPEQARTVIASETLA
jgi:hypothetical protein